MNRLIVIIIVMTLLLSCQSYAGSPKDVILGTTFGTAFGLVAGGTALAWSSKPDDEYPRYLLIGGCAGFIGGMLFGILLPEEKNEPAKEDSSDKASKAPAVLNIDMAASKTLRIDPRAATPTLIIGASSELDIYARLIKLRF